MSKQGKIWGTTQEIYNNGIVSAHAIRIKKGGYCSKHYHEHKSNIFFVTDGSIEITIYKKSGKEDKTILHEGDICVVQAGEYHRFYAIEDSVAIELYEVHLTEDDIIRDDEGGIK